jgi:hypothetical protein
LCDGHWLICASTRYSWILKGKKGEMLNFRSRLVWGFTRLFSTLRRTGSTRQISTDWSKTLTNWIMIGCVNRILEAFNIRGDLVSWALSHECWVSWVCFPSYVQLQTSPWYPAWSRGFRLCYKRISCSNGCGWRLHLRNLISLYTTSAKLFLEQPG